MILAEFEAVAGRETARINRPVSILRSLDGVETGVRQRRRVQPLETIVMRVGADDGTLPTLPDTLRIKASLRLTRNATRDYLDLAALTSRIGSSTIGAMSPACGNLSGSLLDSCLRASLADASAAAQHAQVNIDTLRDARAAGRTLPLGILPGPKT